MTSDPTLMRSLFLRGRTAHPPRKASPTAKRKPTRPAAQAYPRLQRLWDASDYRRMLFGTLAERDAPLPATESSEPC